MVWFCLCVFAFWMFLFGMSVVVALCIFMLFFCRFVVVLLFSMLLVVGFDFC